ncbi:dimethyl sulfoxide reductase anchor subunit [Kiloniella laminariae]|uniref:Dimethyl sulfoxide reductase anchor subunit n=1 Tax=Kiloniella laminariae TaxID=454162 RepID=A0ABT4LN10_9PROT|nr:DmsC/YnfH family molybdoenzyme membrane anchor subunit [Kiloniella laminariae]MCZ4282493.1 dimethyl sulfoxide reductase anchor subunit [Kiloniella laminariae]
MHPARSVILFTTASGAGYGMIFLIVLGQLTGLLPLDSTLAFSSFGTAFALIILGLASSTFHLGRPERAWRALTQWRSSWLSREGIFALSTFIPTGLYALLAAFGDGIFGNTMVLLALASLLLCAATVYCTAMIYASLKPVPAWCNHLVPASYLVLALSSGALLLNCILYFHSLNNRITDGITVILLLAGLVTKFLYWQYIAENKGLSSVGTATGLGKMGKVRLLEAAHSEANYLMKEMGFKIARKHSRRLRKITFVCGFILPVFLISVAGLFASTALTNLVITLSILLGTIGVLTERWLFFAEAKHSVSLYYGAEKL